MNNIKVLIIPDVHGRTFWKEAVNKFPIDDYSDLQIIFLGDYLDPYTGYEGITKEDAFINFEDILDYARNDNRVQLLIGNHDWHYFVNLDECRIDKARERDIEHMFISNIDLFRLSKTVELDGCKYLFSHAGFTQRFLDDVALMARVEIAKWNPGKGKDFVDPEIDSRYIWMNEISKVNTTYDFELFEECLKNYSDTFYSCIPSMISKERGGWYQFGSMIWADVHEHLYQTDIKGFYQIFGHTICYPNGNQMDYAISPNGHCWAMVDASQAFGLDIEGNIFTIK